MGRILKDFLPYLVCFAAGAVLGWFPIVDTDLGHHIATGRYILEHRTIPTTDVFSWTAQGKPWLLHQWIPDVLFACIEARAGITGLIALQSLLLGLITCVLCFASKKRTGSGLISASIAVVGACLLQQRMAIRPFVMGCLCLALLDGFLAALEKKESRPHRMGAFASILAWAAIHPFFVIGLLRWGQHLVEQALRGMRTGREIVSFLIAVVLSLAVVHFVSPSGLKNLASIFSAGSNDYFSSLIVELQPFFKIYPIEPLHLLFGFLLLAWLTLSSDKPFLRITKYSLTLALLAGAMLKARLFAEFIIISTPMAASGLEQIQNRALTSVRHGSSSLFRFGTAAVGAVSLVATMLGSPFVFGVDRAVNLYPPGAAIFLASDPPEHLYNDLMFGGFILWDLNGKVPTFIDGRLEIFGPEFVRDPYRRIFSAGPGWSETLDKWHVDAILLSTSRSKNLHTALAGSQKWHIAYNDYYAIIYRRN